MMRRLIGGLVVGIFLIGQCEASFQQTVDLLKSAIKDKDVKTLTQHVNLEGIVSGKLKQYGNKAQKRGFFARLAGRAAGFSSPLLAKPAASYILKEFSKSSAGLRQSYLNTLNLTQFKEKGNSASASGNFMGRPAVLSAVKVKDRWVVTGAESTVLDAEFKNLMKILHLL